MELRRLMGAFKRKIGWMILAALAGVLLVEAYSFLTYTPVYQSETTLYIMSRRNLLSGEGISFEDIAISKQLIQDYGVLITSRKVLTPVVEELGIKGLNEAMIAASISVDLSEESNVMTISVLWEDPFIATMIANAVSRSFTVQIFELTGFETVGIIDEAIEPRSPLPTEHSKMIMLGFLSGLFIGAGIIYVLELFDSTIREPEEIEKGIGIKILGVIPEFDIR